MLDLDYKVGRDSILFAHPTEMDGFLSDLNKKRKKIKDKIGLSKLNKELIGHKVYNAMSSFESKNRKGLKKAGALVAVMVAVYFVGPSVLAYVKSIGGVAMAQNAAANAAKGLVVGAIKKKLSKSQQAKMENAAQTMTPEQFLADPELAAMSQEVAAEVARLEAIEKTQGRVPDRAKIQAEVLLYKEGAAEVEHQVSKLTPDPIPMWLKIGLPLVILTAII